MAICTGVHIGIVGIVMVLSKARDSPVAVCRRAGGRIGVLYILYHRQVEPGKSC